MNTIFRRAELPQSENNFDPIPAGWYEATVMSVEAKTTKNGTGAYLAIRYKVNGPEHVGRQIFGNINIRNANPVAENIGLQQLGQLLMSVNLEELDLNNLDTLIGHDTKIKVDVRESEQYGNSNEVRGWKALAGPTKPAASGSKPAAPWARK